MAEETRQANVVLTADTNQYSQQMASASTSTTQAADAVNKLFASLERLQRATARRLEIVSATAISGITAATVAAAKFEQQMGQLQAQSAITRSNINLTTKSINELRTSLPVSTEQVIALVGALQKMGTAQTNIKSLADTFIKLGAATGEDIGGLATGLVSLQRAMGTTAGATKEFADQTAYMSAQLGVSATGILQFANNLAPVARTVGMTQTQVMGFSAAFVKAGQDGYAASTVFSKLVTDISRATRYGSNDIYAYANAVGMTAEQFKKLPAAEQATQFFSAISRQGAESIKTLERLGYDGPRALKAIQGLAQSGGLNQAMNAAEVGRTSDATKIGSEKAMDGLNDSLKKLQNTLTSIAQTFGATFLPVITSVVDGVTKLTQVVSNALKPFTALLGVLGLAGGAASGALGAGVSGFGMLTTAAAAYALLRNPLTAGFRAMRATRTGNVPSAFVRNTSENIQSGSKWQQRFFGLGARAGGMIPTGGPAMGPMTAAQSMRASAMGMVGGGIRTLPGRLATGFAGLYSGAMGLAQQSLEPLQMRAIQDATKRPGDAFRESKASWAAFKSGEAAYGASVKAVATSTARLGTSILSASGGIARLGLAATRAAVPGVMGGIAKGAKGLVSGLGGPVGLGLMGGMFAYSAYQGLKTKEAEFRERLADPSAPDSAVNKYATSLGLAGSAAMSFADTVNKASKTIVVENAARAMAMAPLDIKMAKATGRELENKALSKMSKEQATQYATTAFATNADPQIMQAMKLDLIDRFDVPTAQQIISDASSGLGLGAGDIVSKVATSQKKTGPNATKDWFGAFRPTTELKDQLSQAQSTISNNAAYIWSQFGEEESQKYQVSQVNDLLTTITKSSGAPQQEAVLDAIKKITGAQGANFDAGKIFASENAGDRSQELYNQFTTAMMGKTGVGKDFWKTWTGLSDEEAAATAYNMPKVGDNSLYAQLGVYNTKAGGMIRQGPGGNEAMATTVQAALRSPDDANAQLTAATKWGQAVTTAAGSTNEANAQLQTLKARIHDVNDPLYQLASAAQAAVQRLAGWQAANQTQIEHAETARGGLASAIGARADDPERQQNINAALDQYDQQREQLRSQFKSMVIAQRQFDLQTSRSQSDFATQRARTEKDYQLQRKYGEIDYYESKRLQQESFDRQRQRGEEDHQHQIELMIRQNAKTMQDVYSRITTKPTWDAKNLLTNSNDQLAKMRQQQADLATIRGLGLSGDAISQLGLNEFGNQQQLARMVQDLANNPELVTQWNAAIAGKLDISKAFVTDENSESWAEMERQYKLSLDRMSEDFARQNELGEIQYKKTLDRQNLAYAESMKRTGEDFAKQLARAREDLNKSFEIVTNDFNTLADEALGSLTGVTQKQYEALRGSLNLSTADIALALTGTAEDMIKLLAPLFGGEEAARKALSLSAAGISQHAPGGQMSAFSRNGATGTTNPNGGPGGSEYSYDSASSGAFGGAYGTGGANFPLPAGSWSKTSGFGMRHNPVTGIYRLHAGTDLGAKQGTPIGAAEDGIVTKASVMGGLGNMVEVTHGGGVKTWYGHMSLITSKVGQMVGAGEQIGLVGSTGNSTGPHLHFERHINGQAVDPWGYLQGLQSGQITGGAGDMSVMFGLPSGVSMDFSKNQNMQNTEKAFENMVPGGMAYPKGLMTDVLQTRINSMAGLPQDSIGGPTGNYGTSPTGPIGARGSYARGGATMSTASITTIQHIDNGTDFNGGIVVVAQDPDEMGRKLAEKKRMKALTRPSRSA